MAEEKLKDAEALSSAQRWSALYYIAGYAVECGLKACIVKYIANYPQVVFENKKFSENCWTHNLTDLVKLSQLDSQKYQDCKADPHLYANWRIVEKWSEQSRYMQTNQADALKLYEAITQPVEGVMPWIRELW